MTSRPAAAPTPYRVLSRIVEPGLGHAVPGPGAGNTAYTSSTRSTCGWAGSIRCPTRSDFAPIAEQLRRALDDAVATVEWVSGFDFPAFDLEHEFLALRDNAGYPIEDGSTECGTAFSGGRFH